MASHAPLLIALDGAGDQGRLDALLRLDRKETGRGNLQASRRAASAPRRAVRREDVLALMRTDPARDWRPRDIAAALPTATENTFALHMSTWARKNLLVKVQGPTGDPAFHGTACPTTGVSVTPRSQPATDSF